MSRFQERSESPFKVTCYDDKMTLKKSRSFDQEYVLKRGIGRAFSLGPVDLDFDAETSRVLFEIRYKIVHGLDEPAFTLGDDLLHLIDDPTDADVTIRVDNRQFQCHKLILASRSDYFQALLESGMMETHLDEITLEGIPSFLFQEILKYLYSGLVPKDLKDYAMDLFPHADQYLLEDLKEACFYEIAGNICPVNVIQVWKFMN